MHIDVRCLPALAAGSTLGVMVTEKRITVGPIRR